MSARRQPRTDELRDDGASGTPEAPGRGAPHRVSAVLFALAIGAVAVAHFALGLNAVLST